MGDYQGGPALEFVARRVANLETLGATWEKPMVLDTTKFDDVVGKQIVGVVLKRPEDSIGRPHQLFFEFSDGTYLEVYSDSSIRPTRLSRGGRDAIHNYLSPGHVVVYETPKDRGA